MLDKYSNINKEFNKGESKFSDGIKDLSSATNEIKNNTSDVLHDLSTLSFIISDIDRQFCEKTGIVNLKDMTFLWTAIAIQCVRWLVIPNIEEETLTPSTEDRKPSSIEGKKDKTGSNKELDKARVALDKLEFPDSKSIIILPVPYDAMTGTEDIVIQGVTEYGKEINGRNHHAATFGHDPLIGQVIGTANIMTRSISFRDVGATTRKVENPFGRTQIVVKEPYYDIKIMFKDVVRSYNEEHGRLRAALIKENLHLQSDKYTKQGLPIPFITPEKQQKLLRQNWNSKELENVIKHAPKGISINFALASLINTIIGTLHGFCYDEVTDGDLKLYEVRTRKIIAISNVIAERINLKAVIAGTVTGVLSENPELIKKSLSHLDIGGIVEAIHQVFVSKSIQEEIRREYLELELFKRFTIKQYSFLEESHYE